jgi:hypothetical protein
MESWEDKDSRGEKIRVDRQGSLFSPVRNLREGFCGLNENQINSLTNQSGVNKIIRK